MVLESFKIGLLLLVALPGLINTFCPAYSFDVPAMIVYDVWTKALDTEIFSQLNITGLISGITFIVLFSQEKPLRWRERERERERVAASAWLKFAKDCRFK